ncbi:MAG: hypothetical protein ACRCXC_06725 [Legionella sp.]
MFSFCILSAPIFADQDADHKSCMKAITKNDTPGNNTPEYKKFNETMCDCLIEQAKNARTVDSTKISKICFFNALLHYATDDLNTNTTASDMMTACKNLLNVNKDKATDGELKMVAVFCECAQPKLLDLFKQSDSMAEKQYKDGLYSIADSCSANIDLK